MTGPVSLRRILVLGSVALFLLVGAFGAPAAKSQTRFQALRLYIQPYAGTTMTVNGTPTPFRVLRRDKTQALVEARLPAELESVQIRLAHKSRRPLDVTLSLDGEKRRLLATRLPRLLQLRKQQSAFELSEYWPTGSWPKSVTFLDSKRVIVPLLEGKGVDILDLADGSTALVAPAASDAKWKGFVETLVLPDRDEFWVSQMTRASVHVFGISDLKHRRTLKLRASWSKVLTRDRQRGQVYVANWASKNISVIDIASMTETRRLPAGGVPRGMVVAPDGATLYVGQFTHVGESDGRGRVLKVDIKSGRILKYLGTYGAKRHLVADDRGRLFVSDMARSRIEVYDMNTDTQLKEIPVYHKPNTIVLSPDQRFLYVSCRGPNSPSGYTNPGLKMGRIYAIDTQTLTVSEWWEGGNQPTGLDISPDGTLLVSSDFLDSRLRVYRRVVGL